MLQYSSSIYINLQTDVLCENVFKYHNNELYYFLIKIELIYIFNEQIKE